MARRSPHDGAFDTLAPVLQARLREAAEQQLRGGDWQARVAKQFGVQKATVIGWTSGGQYPTAWPGAQAEALRAWDSHREERLRLMDAQADEVLVRAMSRRDDEGKPDREAIDAARTHKADRRRGEEIAQRREAQRVELSGVGGDALVIRCVLPGAEPETDEVAE